VPRTHPSLAHVDLDAFFAAVEQRDKPSLRGKPVIVGGLGPRGVVSTASYEARPFGVASAMATAQARARCPHAAYLYPRFGAYRAASAQVMAALATFSPLIEPLSLDEAYLDLAAGPTPVADAEDARRVGLRIKAAVAEVTGGLTASAGIGTSKLMAKIASDLNKPDGLVVVPPGDEHAVLDPLPVRRLPGVGPATADRLRRAGIDTIGQLRRTEEAELVGLVGAAYGHGLAALAAAQDDREVTVDRVAKSISVEDTYDRDETDPLVLAALVDGLAERVAARMRGAAVAGRTLSVKVRRYDFSTVSRSVTLPSATDDVRILRTQARRLLTEVDVTGGVRLLGVGMSGLASWVQDDLFLDEPSDDASDDSGDSGEDVPADEPGQPAQPARSFADRFPGARQPGWQPGQDVWHADRGPAWVWGSGRGRVTLRFETADTAPGPVATFAVDDPALAPYEPWAAADHT
jgi:DNA polymerase-4